DLEARAVRDDDYPRMRNVSLLSIGFTAPQSLVGDALTLEVEPENETLFGVRLVNIIEVGNEPPPISDSAQPLKKCSRSTRSTTSCPVGSDASSTRAPAVRSRCAHSPYCPVEDPHGLSAPWISQPIAVPWNWRSCASIGGLYRKTSFIMSALP